MAKENKNLGQILQDCGAVKFGDFTLASGKKSKYYIDIKMASTKSQIRKLICQYIIELIKNSEIKVDYIACIELGAVPLGTTVSDMIGLDLIVVRKETKDHGTKNRFMGNFEKGKYALLIEDVTTTGGSTISAAQALRNEGLIVTNVISVVDRDEGAYENLDREGLMLRSLINTETLLREKITRFCQEWDVRNEI